MVRKFLILVSIFSWLAGVSGQKAEKIILDTDMGSDCDDVGALALLHQYAHEGRAEILGIIYSSGAVPYGAGIVDAINRYYGSMDIPIGACYDEGFGDPVDKMQAEILAGDTTKFGNRIIHNTDAIEQTKLNRHLLSESPDHSISYITIGHTRGLYDLLQSPPDEISELSGQKLVQRKIKRWVALGALGAANDEGHLTRDWNFFFNHTAPYTAYLVDHFPGPVYFVDGGARVKTGKSLENTPEGNIVRCAYERWLWNVEKKTLADQRPSWDLVTVLYAVEGPENYFEKMPPGYLEFDPGKGCRWITSDSVSNQHFLRQKEGTDKALSEYLNDMIVK